jgi:autotransporter translocation and assembly factor TamB|tara:strand:- start:1653 stop:2078 length:426 start_codon:yes stop_codon:yes gene_type:complete
MANIQLQRGQQQQVDVTFKLADQTNALNFVTSNGGGGTGNYSAQLVIRKKVGDSFKGEIIDTLTGTIASGSASGRIILGGNPSATDPNINITWSTAQSKELPNETVTVHGDLKISNNSTFASGEVLYHIRLSFDLLEEIVE